MREGFGPEFCIGPMVHRPGAVETHPGQHVQVAQRGVIDADGKDGAPVHQHPVLLVDRHLVGRSAEVATRLAKLQKDEGEKDGGPYVNILEEITRESPKFRAGKTGNNIRVLTRFGTVRRWILEGNLSEYMKRANIVCAPTEEELRRTWRHQGAEWKQFRLSAEQEVVAFCLFELDLNFEAGSKRYQLRQLSLGGLTPQAAEARAKDFLSQLTALLDLAKTAQLHAPANTWPPRLASEEWKGINDSYGMPMVVWLNTHLRVGDTEGESPARKRQRGT